MRPPPPVDCERANGPRAKYDRLIVNMPGAPTSIGKTHRFRYRRFVQGGTEFVVYGADTQQKRRAFDHDTRAAAVIYTPDCGRAGFTL